MNRFEEAAHYLTQLKRFQAQYECDVSWYYDETGVERGPSPSEIVADIKAHLFDVPEYEI